MRSNRNRLLAHIAAGISLILLAALSLSATASAEIYAPYAYNGTYPAGSFMGSDAVGGQAPFDQSLKGIDVNQATGDVYVGAEGGGLLYRFNSAGVAQPFSSVAPNTVLSGIVTNGFGETVVDNSGAATQGRIYQWSEQSPVKAFLPSGEELNSSNGFPKFPMTETGDNCGADVAPSGNIWISRFNQGVQEYDPSGNPTNAGPAEGFIHAEGTCSVAIDSEENFYTSQYAGGLVRKWNKAGELLGTVDTNLGEAASLAVDRSNDNLFINYRNFVKQFNPEGNLLGTFGSPDAGRSYPGFNNSEGVAVNENTHVVYVTDRFPGRVDEFAPAPPQTIPDVITEAATNITATGGTLHGNVDPDAAHGGTEIIGCEFRWGLSPSNLNNTATCDQPLPINGNEDVTATIEGLTAGASYFFQLTAKNSENEIVAKGKTLSFQPAGPPVIADASVSNVHSDGAVLSGTIDPQGGKTTYQIEYGATEAYGGIVPQPEGELPNSLGRQSFSYQITGLEAGTLYHFRVTATNANDTTHGEDHTFTTFPFTAILNDPCPNAHVRQQVAAALLPDCRAYELVSAADTGGYDVESDLVAGQHPFGGYPEAHEKVLYGIHSGAIPGPWNPTNRGVDPYIASRGSNGWRTTYAGIPADNPFAATPFASELDEASPGLTELAFGGPNICSPCFADGSTGIPLREEDGSLAQGMAGPEEPGPGAAPDGLVEKRFSADGTHLIFGSTSLFADGGNDETGDVSIYDRNLMTGQTQVVSTDPGGNGLACLQGSGHCHSPGDKAGIAELDVSRDGSRIVVGQLMRTDAAGNRYFHLYMHVGTSPGTIDLTPGTTTGALYDGMTADGSSIYFTTRDPLATASDPDSDTSADIYRADASSGSATLTRVSVGSGAGNGDSCDPVPNATNEHWNAVSGGPDCSAVAIGGGGGVASDSGAIYFLSPEQLDGGGNGTPNAPNLYVEEPGSSPRYVVTLESSLTAPDPPTEYHPYDHSFGTVQKPQFVAVDASGGPSDGDVYVVDNASGGNVVRKYDPAGNLITSWADNGVLDGSTTAKGLFKPISGVAVGPDGKLYVGVYELFNGEDELFEFDEDGTFSSEHGVEGAIQPFGISVDGSGNVFYVGYSETVERFDGSTSTEISGLTEGQYGEPIAKSGLAVDPNSGDLYVGIGGESVAKFSFDGLGRVVQNGGAPCNSRCLPTATFGANEVSGASGMTVDPSNGDLYVDEGSKILRFDFTGLPVAGPATGIGRLNNSNSIAVGGDGWLYANTKIPGGANVAAFAPLTLAPEPRTDSPLIVDAVNDAGTRHTADFQVTPSGDDAAFPSAISITGFDNAGNPEIFRYDLASGSIDCASCNPTGARAIGGASMAVEGLSLSDDGRVFFNSNDALAPRDLDNRQDAYEWNGDNPQLISTGGSPFDSSLLSASADGTDVYFFTRDTLVPQDKNGTLAKIYDAREEGGFPFPPDPVPCKASDECHGAGSAAPGPLPIGTITGNGGNSEPQVKTCRKGFKRHGNRCVKKKKSKRKHHRTRRRSRR
ncbi:MAG TPA: hypothetical protein VHQ97_08475 [Solirubrobacterales bacterium]|jgi:hypothetical protein|nr:hypothetical protein [Solirubrobacterales bacterium]